MGTRSRAAARRKPNTCDQMTSTSDPVIEEDHPQVNTAILVLPNIIKFLVYVTLLKNIIRDDIKSFGKFAIFTRLKIGGGWVKRADFGKIRTKDRNFYVRDFGKI